ncbi:MAG: PAS domain S-box protein, partial [Bacteroidota bacterium]|nr:PAS domain S-box protein [Bacteroidota bacterium]
MPIFSKEFSILIIEDDENDFIKLEGYLKDLIVNPIIKRSQTFKQALDILNKGIPFDVIFLDLTLPDVNSKQLVSEILPMAGDTPIIVITHNDVKNSSVKMLSLGISDYLFKNEINPSLLLKSIVYNIQQKKISIELRESEKKYRNLFQVCPIPMWVFDPDTFRFLQVNDAATKHYGYSNEEFLSLTIEDIRPYEEIEKMKEAVEINKKNTGFFRGVFNHRKKNGEIIQVEIQSNAIDFNGKKAKLIIASDVTEKLKAEKALKLSEQLFKALVQDGADLIGILDLDGNYKYVSPSAATVVGVNADALIGKNAFDYIHDDDRQRVINQYNLLKRKKRIQISPFRFRNINSDWIWLETIATNMLDDPSVQGIVSTSRDITLNINYNQKLKQNF